MRARGRCVDTGELVTVEVDQFILDDPLECNGMKLDPIGLQFTINGRPVDLTPSQFRFMTALMVKPGRRVTWEELCRVVSGNPRDESAYRSILAHLCYLRKKVPGLVTVFGRGVRLEVTKDN